MNDEGSGVFMVLSGCANVQRLVALYQAEGERAMWNPKLTNRGRWAFLPAMIVDLPESADGFDRSDKAFRRDPSDHRAWAQMRTLGEDRPLIAHGKPATRHAH